MQNLAREVINGPQEDTVDLPHSVIAGNAIMPPSLLDVFALSNSNTKGGDAAGQSDPNVGQHYLRRVRRRLLSPSATGDGR
ncbi:hypothetical protein CRG98_023869 [Punica granatum]|uniref:Uncharacterized protein n=1 Tax=Punica granatum TaxID=22663 RepID=A0A2I0JHL1_PUNGR|nr:hypothetical protein CRG98_023869 [Punica granatum]